MRPEKIGQIVKFHNPFPDENPNQLYVVLEIINDEVRSSVLISPLNTGLSVPPTQRVSINDLVLSEVSTLDLIGHRLTILKDDSSRINGSVVKVLNEKIVLEMNKTDNDIFTNVRLSVIDTNGVEHFGNLILGNGILP